MRADALVGPVWPDSPRGGASLAVPEAATTHLSKPRSCPVDAPWPGTDGYAQEDITWVSLLLDLKRGESGNDQFRRSMQEYYDRFQRILDRGFKMVIFIPKEFESHLKLDKT